MESATEKAAEEEIEEENAEAKLFAFLEALNIETQTHRHTPVFTVEEAQAARAGAGGMPGGHAKSLFIRDKKKRHALVMVHEDRRVNLKALATKIGLGRVSFGSADSLREMLGVIPGSVTPFALVNAQASSANGEPPMIVALDEKLMVENPLWFHPLHNAATTSVAPAGLIAFIEACGYKPLRVNLDEPQE